MSVSQLNDGRWCVRGRPGYWPDEPKRTQEYFGRGVGAEQAARARDMELGGRSARAPASGPTFAELAKEYFEKRRWSPKSRKELKIRLEAILLPAIGHRRAVRLQHADLDLYVERRRAHRTKRGSFVKDSTIRRELTDIKSILNWAVKRRPPLLAFNPVATYQAPESDNDVIIPPSPDEAAAIYQAAAEHLRRAITLSWYLGLRPGRVELLGMRWADVSLQVGVIRVRSANKGGPKFRDVPIHSGLRKHLEAWQKADRAATKKKDIERLPIIHYQGRQILKFQSSWEGALRRAKIKRRIRPYDLRHAFASRALEAGADVGAVSHAMGSRPETIRAHYQHVTREMTRRTVELIPELDTSCVACAKDDAADG